MDREVLRELIKVSVRFRGRDDLKYFAQNIFNFYTERGLPPDFAFDAIEERQPLTKDEKLYILSRYQDYDMEHKHKSSITPKRQETQQKRNRDTIASFLKTGEVGMF